MFERRYLAISALLVCNHWALGATNTCSENSVQYQGSVISFLQNPSKPRTIYFFPKQVRLEAPSLTLVQDIHNDEPGKTRRFGELSAAKIIPSPDDQERLKTLKKAFPFYKGYRVVNLFNPEKATLTLQNDLSSDQVSSIQLDEKPINVEVTKELASAMASVFKTNQAFLLFGFLANDGECGQLVASVNSIEDATLLGKEINTRFSPYPVAFMKAYYKILQEWLSIPKDSPSFQSITDLLVKKLVLLGYRYPTASEIQFKETTGLSAKQIANLIVKNKFVLDNPVIAYEPAAIAVASVSNYWRELELTRKKVQPEIVNKLLAIQSEAYRQPWITKTVETTYSAFQDGQWQYSSGSEKRLEKVYP